VVPSYNHPMSEDVHGGLEGPGDSEGSVAEGRDDTRPSLTTEVRRRRADPAFFLRLRDAIQQNHRALERLGT
jgi:hypothetical protein